MVRSGARLVADLRLAAAHLRNRGFADPGDFLRRHAACLPQPPGNQLRLLRPGRTDFQVDAAARWFDAGRLAVADVDGSPQPAPDGVMPDSEVSARELAYYEKLYSGFAQAHFARPAVRALRRHMVGRIRSLTGVDSRSRVLRLGCGIGGTRSA